MATLKYWDAGTNQYVVLPVVSSAAPSNMVATIINTPTVASSPYTITHNMSTTNVMVQAWDTVTNDLIVVRMHIVDTNHVQVFFEQNCPNNVNVLVIGGAGSLAPAPVVAARALGTASTAIASGVNTPVPLNSVEYDTHGGLTPSTSTYTVPAGQPGDYLVTGAWASTNLATGTWMATQVLKNGVGYAVGNQMPMAVNGTCSIVSTVVRCNAGDTLQLIASAGAACNFYGGSTFQYMSVHRIFPGLQAAGAFVPSQVPPPTGNNVFTDSSGEVWRSLNGSAWTRARPLGLLAAVMGATSAAFGQAATIIPSLTVTATVGTNRWILDECQLTLNGGSGFTGFVRAAFVIDGVALGQNALLQIPATGWSTFFFRSIYPSSEHATITPGSHTFGVALLIDGGTAALGGWESNHTVTDMGGF
jgi:hypothetical protein